MESLAPLKPVPRLRATRFICRPPPSHAFTTSQNNAHAGSENHGWYRTWPKLQLGRLLKDVKDFYNYQTLGEKLLIYSLFSSFPITLLRLMSSRCLFLGIFHARFYLKFRQSLFAISVTVWGATLNLDLPMQVKLDVRRVYTVYLLEIIFRIYI